MECQFCEKEIESPEIIMKNMNCMLKLFGNKAMVTIEESKMISDKLISISMCYYCKDYYDSNLYNMKNKFKRSSIVFIRKQIKDMENSNVIKDKKFKIKYSILKLMLNQKIEYNKNNKW